ncbi:MAG TPA: hypothetical protein VFN25_12605 [Dokdonella sp.]|uniref:hypothetical protein n=1 Tax=Dokdonella sp. TaxID=2291710 RepID=UPI002D7E3054|nr:hypothetical protein [Dokdonella sp.]HET9033732.1 hypothetical protein [Dokdonella sp.]
MNTQRTRRDVWIMAISILAIAFGLLTVKEGGTVLFGGDAARAAAGHYVPFVLWFNFLAGFAYVVAGAGLWWRQRWAARLAIAICAATLLIFSIFLFHIGSGGSWEQRTLFAMILRSGVWLTIAGIASHCILRSQALAN